MVALIGGSPLGLREIVRYVAPYFLALLGAGLAAPFFNVLFKSRFGVDDRQLGFALGTSRLISRGTALLGPLIGERVGQVRSMTLFGLISVPFLLGMAFLPTYSLSVVAMWLRDACLLCFPSTRLW